LTDKEPLRTTPARPRLWLAAAVVSALLAGCASEPPPLRVAVVAPPAPKPPVIDEAVYRRAEIERTGRLEAEIIRLRTDLQKAEEALILAESGMRGTYSRADAVSGLAESRIEVERVAGRAPWRSRELDEARSKLDEAERQIAQDHYGAALFFIHRAQRMGKHIDREATEAEASPRTLFVKATRVNLRSGPSSSDEVVRVLAEGLPVFPEQTLGAWTLVRASDGAVGWVHSALLGRPRDGR